MSRSLVLPVRDAVRVLLMNADRELLLLCGEDTNIKSIDGQLYGRIWFTVGGGIEQGEDVFEAAYRETFEETGITRADLILGPIVWFGSFDAIFCGRPTCMKQTFIVAHTRKRQVCFDHLDVKEKTVIQEARWFSLEQMKASAEPIFPRQLVHLLPDIMEGRYPEAPYIIDVSQ